ncbi:MAG: DUF2062 domain-containing protein [Planctomycetota bacterium]|jgi:uncharacterized protein (DUF2062 family)
MRLMYFAKGLRRIFVYRVLHADDTPHRIALGVAVGIFITWTPTMGLQMALTAAMAWLLGANKLVGIPFVWISNPLTAAPLYGFNFKVGKMLLGSNYQTPRFSEVFAVTGSSWWEALWNCTHAFWIEMWKVFPPLWLGSVLLGLALGAITYFLVYRTVVAYRQLRQHRRAARRARALSN